jgi:hypothetical protein
MTDSDMCGCFYCLATYSPADITERIDEDEAGSGITALCPRCGIDSLIANKSGYPITKEFLEQMHRAWFS